MFRYSWGGDNDACNVKETLESHCTVHVIMYAPWESFGVVKGRLCIDMDRNRAYVFYQ